MTEYVPDRGDLILIGESDRGEPVAPMPAVVLTPRQQHMDSGEVLICPVQDAFTGHPFEVPFPTVTGKTKTLAAHRIQRLPIRNRRTWRIGKAPREVVKEVTKRMVLMMS